MNYFSGRLLDICSEPRVPKYMLFNLARGAYIVRSVHFNKLHYAVVGKSEFKSPTLSLNLVTLSNYNHATFP